jgi:hypothetical protein
MAGILERAGLRRRKSAHAFFWAVEIYERPASQ